jgi:hypothetical protein
LPPATRFWKIVWALAALAEARRVMSFMMMDV